jgi:hypothetical protein
MKSPEQIREKFMTALELCLPEQLHARVFLRASQKCEILASDTQFVCILAELINNCTEKPAEHIEVNVSIDFNESQKIFHMSVEDNIIYEAKKAQEFVRILNSHRQIKTADKRPDIMKPLTYGVGIVMARNYLAGHDGRLVYRKSDDHRIIAEANWKK